MKKRICITCLMLGLISFCFATNWYVNQNTLADKVDQDGKSWATAFDSVQLALDSLQYYIMQTEGKCYDDILIKKGIYVINNYSFVNCLYKREGNYFWGVTGSSDDYIEIKAIEPGVYFRTDTKSSQWNPYPSDNHYVMFTFGQDEYDVNQGSVGYYHVSHLRFKNITFEFNQSDSHARIFNAYDNESDGGVCKIDFENFQFINCTFCGTGAIYDLYGSAGSVGIKFGHSAAGGKNQDNLYFRCTFIGCKGYFPCLWFPLDGDIARAKILFCTYFDCVDRFGPGGGINEVENCLFIKCQSYGGGENWINSLVPKSYCMYDDHSADSLKDGEKDIITLLADGELDKTHMIGSEISNHDIVYDGDGEWIDEAGQNPWEGGNDGWQDDEIWDLGLPQNSPARKAGTLSRDIGSKPYLLIRNEEVINNWWRQ